MQIKIEAFYKLMTTTRNKKFAYFCNIFGKMWVMKFIFCLYINMEVPHKLILLFWMCVSRYVQSTQKDKVAIYLQYIQKVMSGEVFSHVDKQEVSLQTNTMIFDGNGRTFPKFSKYQIYNVLTISSETS